MTYQEALNTFSEAYAVPGSDSIIDIINPHTGLTACYGHTIEQVRKRHPTAERVNLNEWQQAKAAKQDAPIVWHATDRRTYHDMLNVLPPARWIGGAFLVGEPMDHHATSGQPRFTMYRAIGEDGPYARYEVADRPVTVREFLIAIGRAHEATS